MATYDAGDASINIRPSLKGFVTELEADLKKIDAQLGVAVHPNLAQAQADLARWRAQEERNSIDIPVNVDTNSVQHATREMGKLADAGKALSALKWNAGALGLGSLPAAATVLANVAGAMQQISQAGLLLPGVMAAGAASIGTFKIGVVGVADAFEAVEKSADGSAKSIEAANKALAGLAPSAADAVRTAVDVKKELTEALQKPIQQKLFEGVSGDLRKLVSADLPVLQKGLTGIASGLNQNLRQLMASAGSESSQGLLDRILGNTGDAQARLSKAIDPLIHGLGTLAAAGTDTFPRLADGVGRLAERFDRFISAADQDGRLAKWIDDGIKGVEHLGSIVLDLGKTFAGITKAAGGGEGLLSMLDAGAEKLATFVNSAEGQEKLKQFFTEGREQLAQWFEILKNVGSTLGDVYNGAKQWTDTLLPPLKIMTGLLSEFPGLVQAGVVAFLAYRTVKPFTGLLTGLRQVNSELTTMQSKSGAIAAGGGGAAGAGRRGRIRSIAGDLGPTLALAGISELATSDSGGGQALGALTSIAGGAITGAALGGPAGALIGGGAAAAVSALTFVLSENARAAKEASDKAAAYAESVRRAAETSRVAAGLQTDLRTSLFSSGGAVDAGVTSAVTQRLQNLPTELADLWKATPKQIEGVKDALAKLNVGQDQLAGTITGSQPVFDAMIATLRSQGDAGNIAAQSLISIRDGFLQGKDAAESSAPLLTDLAAKLNTDLPQAAANITTAFNSVPKNVELKADMPGADAVLELLGQMNAKVTVDNDKTIHTDIPLAPDVLAQLREITGLVINNNDKTISVGIDQQRYVDSLSKLEVLGDYLRSLPNINVAPPAPPSVPKFPTAPLPGADTGAGILLPPAVPKRAGGEISGGEPGKDSVHLLGMPGEHMLTTDDVAAMGGQGNVYAFRRALHSGKVRGYSGGGAVVDEFGNPVNPGIAPGPGAAPSIAPNPFQGGGLAGIFGSVLSGIQGPIGVMALGSSLANLGGQPGADSGIVPGLQTQHGAGTIVPAGYTSSGGTGPLSLADRAAGIPGLWGLLGSLGSSNPAQNLMAWGEQTGQWLGNFTARTVGSFATSLWKGALGIFGLENSILSPDNPWNLAGQSVGQFAFGSEGPLGKLLGANPGAGAAGSDTSRKQMDPKKIREAQQKVADKQKAVEEQRARMADMPAKASQSTRMARQNALDKAIREANDAQSDLTALLSGATASGSGMSGLAYPIGGSGAEQWRPTVRQVLAAYGPAYGITGSNFQSWEDALVRQIATESGGDPNSVNANDSNGRGGTQRVAGILNFLQSTFEAHNITGGDYMDPGSQIAAALPYVAKRWGVDENGAPLQIGRGQGFAFGGGVRGPGGPKGDQIPAMLSDNEHVLTSEDVDAMGGQSAVYAFRGALHRAPGGEVSLALLRNPTPPPRPTVPDIKPMNPRPAAPAPAPRPAPAPVAPQPAAPAAQGPQPGAPAPARQEGGPFQSQIGGPGPGAAPTQLNHNLPWIDTAIDSTASTLGNIAATAISMGAAGGSAGMGGGAGGALASSMVAGLFQQGGKIAKNVVNVFSSALVGNLGDNTTAGAYGAPVLSAPPQPARSIDARTVFGDVSANDPRDFVEKQRLYEQQRSQTMVDYV